MAIIQNGQISQYCNFNKIKKGPGTSFWSPALNKKHVDMFAIQHTSIWPNFILIVLKKRNEKEKSRRYK